MSRRRADKEPQIQLTPLIDILFIILIFIFLTASFQHFYSLRVKLPKTTAGERQADDRIFEVVVRESGEVYVEGRPEPLTLDQLGKVLMAVHRYRKLALMLAADARTDHEIVVKVLDLARRAGFTQIQIGSIQSE